MRKVFSLVVALGTLATVPAAQTSNALPSAPQILSAGSGEVLVRPDRITVTIAVVTTAPSAAEAGRLNAERVAPVLAAIRRQGVADSSIAASGYAVATADRDYNEAPRPAGSPPTYRARNAIRMSLSQLESVGRIIDAALAAGATEVSGLNFSSSDEEQARRRAFELAIAAARADAEVAAAAAGGRLGRLIELQLGTTPYGRAALAMAGSSGFPRSQATTVAPNDIRVSAVVEKRFEFVPRP